jgi:hypothetical protein
MKLVYTEQAIISLQECLDFFPPEMPAKKVNELETEYWPKQINSWIIRMWVNLKNI